MYVGLFGDILCLCYMPLYFYIVLSFCSSETEALINNNNTNVWVRQKIGVPRRRRRECAA